MLTPDLIQKGKRQRVRTMVASCGDGYAIFVAGEKENSEKGDRFILRYEGSIGNEDGCRVYTLTKYLPAFWGDNKKFIDKEKKVSHISF